MQLIDLLGATSVKLIAIATVITATLGTLDTRHAKASDFQRLLDSGRIERIDNLEDDITKTEDSINRLKVSGALSDSQKLYLNQLSDRKAKYLRKLKRLNGGK